MAGASGTTCCSTVSMITASRAGALSVVALRLHATAKEAATATTASDAANAARAATSPITSAARRPERCSAMSEKVRGPPPSVCSAFGFTRAAGTLSDTRSRLARRSSSQEHGEPRWRLTSCTLRNALPAHRHRGTILADVVGEEVIVDRQIQAAAVGRGEAPEMPELLHPRMADVYRERVTTLCQALEHEDSRLGATTAIRELIEAILLEPDGEQLKITLKGDLAGMLSASGDSKRSPDTSDLLVQIQMVAGAGFEPATFGL